MENKVAASPSDYVDEYNSLIFIINNVINNKVRTAELVRVIANNGDGTIDVLPIISDVDNNGNYISQSPIFNVKYLKWRYGINEINAEPAIGDVGMVLVCTKDTQNASSGIVGSYERFSLASGIYIGGLNGFNQPATQSIKMDENGITITTPKTLTVNATENVVVNAGGNANIIASSVNLGIEGGKAIALDGDQVISGSTVIGTVKASSTTTKSG